MRDPKRITRICRKLEQLWDMNPDQRLGQLIENYVISSGILRGGVTAWLFFREDDETEACLDKALEESKNQ